MKAILLSLLIFVVRINVSGQKNNIGQRVEGFAGHPLEIVEADGYRLPVYDFDGIKPILYMKGDTTYVVNFWATWCKPCVQELPGFLDLSKELEGDKVRFFFVSLDFRKNAVNSVIPFLKSKEMNQGVMILDDPDANHWINQVDPGWAGSIPATLIYHGNKREFHESRLSHDQLKAIIHSFLNS